MSFRVIYSVVALALSQIASIGQLSPFSNPARMAAWTRSAATPFPYIAQTDCQSDPGGSWTTTGATWGSAASPAPLYSGAGNTLLMDANTENVYYTLSPELTEGWVFFAVQLNSLTGDPYPCQIRTSDGATVVARVRFMSDGAVRAYAGTTQTASAAGVVAINTTYFVWVYFQKGTGANSVCTVYVSTTQTKPGSPTVSRTIGDATVNAGRVQFSHLLSAMTGGWNKLRIASIEIPSNPQ